MTDSQTPKENPSEHTRPLNYMRQLDGLRCIAVFLVLYQHFVPTIYRYEIVWGRLGVRLFFVLSGFLITKILLDCRDRAAKGDVTRGIEARQFYARRFLRIFPVYYATLFLAVLIGYPYVQDELGWHLAYLSNVKFSFYGGFTIQNPTSHFWSLAVEEQFYLIWPWLILFLPRKAILPVVVATFFVAPIYRFVGHELGWAANSLKLFTPSCMDTLGIGALLAVLERGNTLSRTGLNRLTNGFAIVGFPAMVYLYSLPKQDPLFVILGDTAVAVFFAWCVWGASNGFRGPLGKALEFGPVVYFGKISYGIYVLHLFVPYFYITYLLDLGFPRAKTHHILVVSAAYTIITLLAASVSWYLYEKPLNGLKRFFPYNVSSKREASQPIPAAVLADDPE